MPLDAKCDAEWQFVGQLGIQRKLMQSLAPKDTEKALALIGRTVVKTYLDNPIQKPMPLCMPLSANQCLVVFAQCRSSVVAYTFSNCEKLLA